MSLLYRTCDLSLDEMSLIDQQRKYSNHGNSIISSILITSLINLTHPPQIFSLTVYFIANAISHIQICSVSHTLFLSLCYLALSPASFVWYKNPVIHFHLIIDLNKLIWITSLFHLEVAHNTDDKINIKTDKKVRTESKPKQIPVR